MSTGVPSGRFDGWAYYRAVAEFFTEVVEPIRYAGPDSDDPLTFRWYDADRHAARSSTG